MAKFASKEDLVKVLCNGPCKVLDHYLLIQGCKPKFRPSIDSFDSTPVLVRLPELPIEFFEKDLLISIEDSIGKTI